MSDDNYRLEKPVEKIEELNAQWAQRMEDAVKNERQRLKTIIDDKICFYESLDRELSDVEYGRFKELRKLRQELRGEVSNGEEK